GENRAQVWDAATGRPAGAPLEHGAGVWHAEFSRDGRHVLTVAGDTARVWDAATGRRVLPVLKHSGLVVHGAFSPDGRRLVTSGGETTQVWDTAAVGPPPLPLRHGRGVWRAPFQARRRRRPTARPGGAAPAPVRPPRP